MLTDIAFAKIAESGDGGTGKFSKRNLLVNILDEANKGRWLISLNMLKTVPTNDLIVICTGKMMSQIELSPPEKTAEKCDMNNPGTKFVSLQNNSKPLDDKIADIQTGTEINSDKDRRDAIVT